MPITTNVVSSNLTQVRCTWYNIMWSSDLRQFRGFQFSSTNKTEKLFIVALNTITLTHIYIYL